MLDGQGVKSVIPTGFSDAAVQSLMVDVSDLIDRAGLEPSQVSPAFAEAGIGVMTFATVSGNAVGPPADSPAQRVDPNVGGAFGGVVAIEITDPFIDPVSGQPFKYICTGSVVSPTHILTASHCFDNHTSTLAADFIPDGNLDSGLSASVQFNNGGSTTANIVASNITLHPSFSPGNGHDDLSLVELSTPIPAGTPIYPLHASDFFEPNLAANEDGDIVHFVGYGKAGFGDVGVGAENCVPATCPPGTVIPTLPVVDVKRTGQNRAEFFQPDDDGSGAQEIFFYDFDGPSDPTDPNFGFFSNGTLGNDIEATIALGDSGGPSFVDADPSQPGLQPVIAGVNTFTFETGGADLGQYFQKDAAGNLLGTLGGGVVVNSYIPWIESIIDVDLQVSTSVASVAAGSGGVNSITYDVTVANAGPATATSVSIAETFGLPLGVTIASAPNWNLGSIAAGASATVSVVFDVDSTVANSNFLGVALNATSLEGELVPGDNSIVEVIPITFADLELNTSFTSVAGTGGINQVVYTVDVSNLGPNAASNIDILNTIVLPAGVTIAAPPPIWTIATLAPNTTASITVTFDVDTAVANGADTIDITLDGTASEHDVDAGNDLISDSLSLTMPVSVDIRGATWGVAPFSLNEGTNRVLPWANLDELTVTYAAPRPTAPALTLFGPTDGGGTITPTLTDWDAATATATYTYPALQSGYYRVGTENTNYDFGVLPGDSNGNGVVNFADFGVFGPSFGLNYLTGPPLPAPHIADYNGNGIVNFADFGVFGPAFGSNLNAFTPPTGPAPPPPPPLASFAALAIDAAWASIFDADDDEDEVDSLLVV